MSGVFGLVDIQRKANISSVLNNMAECMSHRDWYVAEQWQDPSGSIGVGRLGIGIFNRERQPATNEEGDIHVLLAGEFYDTTPLRQVLVQKGYRLRTESQAELLLRLYQDCGTAFVQNVAGAFIAAIYDARRRHLLLIGDRYGLYPLYYAYQPDKLVFAPELKGVLCDSTLKPTLDVTALAQYMRFQHLLGERTFFNEVHLFPHGTILDFDLQTGEIAFEQYWDFDRIPDLIAHITFQEAVIETGRLLRHSIRRLASGPHRCGVYLSGGLDSRTILGLATSQRGPIPSLTYGASNSRDVVYAKKVACAVDSPHYYFDFKDGTWIRDFADFHLELTEGFHSWIHAHGINTLAGARAIMDVNLSGWDGGTIMGDSDTVDPTLTDPVDETALLCQLFQRLNQSYTWPGMNEAEESLLFTDTFNRQIHSLAFDSLQEELSRTVHYATHNRAAYFYLLNHCRRLTHHMITFTRSHIEVRFPFYDYRLIEFLYAIPPALRAQKRLYRAVMNRELPRLSRIPYAYDEFLPTENRVLRKAHATGVKARRFFNRHVSPIFTERSTLYADYEEWLRGDLCPWAENILFDGRLAQRGIFNPDTVRSLWARHQSARELWTIGKIAPIMAYEMMLRRLYD